MPFSGYRPPPFAGQAISADMFVIRWVKCHACDEFCQVDFKPLQGIGPTASPPKPRFTFSPVVGFFLPSSGGEKPELWDTAGGKADEPALGSHAEAQSRRETRTAPQGAPLTFSDHLQSHTCEDGVAAKFGDCDEGEEAPEGFAHDAGGDGERIADEGGPAHQQRPAAITRVPVAGAGKRGGACREPAALLKAERCAAKPIIHQRAEHIADACDDDEGQRRMLARDEEADKHGFRLRGEKRRGDEGREEERGVG